MDLHDQSITYTIGIDKTGETKVRVKVEKHGLKNTLILAYKPKLSEILQEKQILYCRLYCDLDL